MASAWRQLQCGKRERGYRSAGTWRLALGALLAALLFSPPVLGSPIETILEPFTGSDSSVRVRLEESGIGEILMSIQVVEGVADIRGVFFDIADDSLLEGLQVTGDWVTSFDASGRVIQHRRDNNLRGGGSPCPCDVGVQIGTSGMGRDDVQWTSLVLSHPDTALSLSLFYEQDIGVRLTSVGEDDSGREGSSKLGGIVPVPEPSTLLLVGLGAVGLGARARSRRR